VGALAIRGRSTSAKREAELARTAYFLARLGCLRFDAEPSRAKPYVDLQRMVNALLQTRASDLRASRAKEAEFGTLDRLAEAVRDRLIALRTRWNRVVIVRRRF